MKSVLNPDSLFLKACHSCTTRSTTIQLVVSKSSPISSVELPEWRLGIDNKTGAICLSLAEFVVQIKTPRPPFSPANQAKYRQYAVCFGVADQSTKVFSPNIPAIAHPARPLRTQPPRISPALRARSAQFATLVIGKFGALVSCGTKPEFSKRLTVQVQVPRCSTRCESTLSQPSHSCLWAGGRPTVCPFCGYKHSG